MARSKNSTLRTIVTSILLAYKIRQLAKAFTYRSARDVLKSTRSSQRDRIPGPFRLLGPLSEPGRGGAPRLRERPIPLDTQKLHRQSVALLLDMC
jgi:hypothetical protein